MEVKDFNVKIDGKNLFNQTIKNDLRTYDKIWKIAAIQGDEYTTVCVLDYIYFTEYYKPIAIDLSKQQKLDADPKAIQQINFNRNINRAEVAIMIFIIEETKKTVLDFSIGRAEVLWFYFVLT